MIDDDATKQPTDTACQTASSQSALPHWTFATQLVKVDVPVPRDLAIADVFEVREDGVRDVSGVTVSGRTISLNGVKLDDARPARLFVLARDPSLRKSLPQ